MKKKYLDENIPYSVRTNILKFAQQSKKPRQHIELSKKQLKGQEQYLIPMKQRIDRENKKKDSLVQQYNTNGLDRALYTIVKKRYHDYLLLETELQQQMWAPIKRTPNYYKYVSTEFLRHLHEHPYSQKIHISTWHQDAIIFFRDNDGIVVVHFTLPEDVDFFDYTDIKRYILENDVPVTDYQTIY